LSAGADYSLPISTVATVFTVDGHWVGPSHLGFDPTSPIYNQPESQPDLIGIYVGTLDDASAFQPSIVLFNARGYAWDKLDPDVPRRPHWHEKKT